MTQEITTEIGSSSGGGTHLCVPGPGVSCPDRIVGHDPMIVILIIVAFILTAAISGVIGWLAGHRAAQADLRRE